VSTDKRLELPPTVGGPRELRVVSPFEPAGDQPKAIEELTQGVKRDLHYQTLLGVTGSGKTFTMAKVIEAVQKPTLVMAPNKTLAAQLASELRRGREAAPRRDCRSALSPRRRRSCVGELHLRHRFP